LSKSRKKNVTDALLIQIQQLKESRDKAIDKYYLSFLINIYREMSFRNHVKNVTNDFDDNQDIYITSVSYSIISLVSCWETFFRDIFVFIINTDNEVTERLLMGLDNTIRDRIIESETVADYFSKLYNFQSINDIKEAFFLVLNDKDIFTTIGEFIIPFINKEEVYKFSLNHSFSKWFDYVELMFIERHKIVHDANYRAEILISKLEKAEDAFLYFPQIFAIWLQGRYKIKTNIMTTIMKENPIPALMTRELMIGGKWYIQD
jgi:hypothetical protein